MPGSSLLIVQIGTILLVARIVGWLFSRVHQPRVVGEMAAGILLGPSLLGWLAPGVFATLFPTSSLAPLNALSQVGLLIFMFLIGLELDLRQLRELGRVAVLTSQVSIIVPFALGSLFALYLYPRVTESNVSLVGFVLFMGAAMSVTAFPVLARILSESELIRTRVGLVAISCAAVDDVTAWCMLAAITVIVRSQSFALPVWFTLTGLVGFILVMVLGVRRALRRLTALYRSRRKVTEGLIAVILLVIFASGWVTEGLGVHALFGAFLAGVVMPRDQEMARELSRKFEALVLVLLVPLYFAMTGLRSSVFLISGARMWSYCALVIVLAMAGKMGGSALSAKLNGMSWRESAAIGILMNTRGLVELVILNIGLDLGILSPTLFSIMVIMALVTTLMTTPLLHWVYPQRAPVAVALEPEVEPE